MFPTMEPFDSYEFLPNPPRGGIQGHRRRVAPVWWNTCSSDESSYSISDLVERQNDESIFRDEKMQDLIQYLEAPVQFEVSDPPNLADKTEHQPAKSANPLVLRRRPAMVSLSKQYLESGKCSALGSHETGTAQGQTIHPAVATQESRAKTNYRARHRLLPAGTNQPEKIKISSRRRGASAQTNAGQQFGHKTDREIRVGAEDTTSRSSIISEETARTRGVGSVSANIGLVQHSEASKLSPKRAEFLDSHSSSAYDESLLLLPRRNRSSARNRTKEQSKLTHIQPPTGRFDNKFSAPAKDEHKGQRQAAMRVKTGPPQAWDHYDDDLVKLAATSHWGDQSNPHKWLLDADNMLSQRPQASTDIPQLWHGANGRRPLPQRPLLVPGILVEGQPRSGFVLGQAKAIKLSKPGKPRLINITSKKSWSFSINSLSSEEADLMASMGAVARSSRRSSPWTDDEQSHKGASSDIDVAATAPAPAAGTVLPKRDVQQSRIPQPIRRGKQGEAHLPKQQGDEYTRIGRQDVRLHQLEQWLDKIDPENNPGARHPAVQGMSLMNRGRGAAPREQSETPIIHDQGLKIKYRPSEPKHKQVRFSLPDQSQRRSPIDDGPARFRQLVRRLEANYPRYTLPSRIPVDTKPKPRDSGCPSLISDDGGEPFDSPGDTAYQFARAQICQGSHTISAWETDKAASAVAPQEAPSNSRFDLFNLSPDDEELVSGEDASEDHADEDPNDGNGRGRWYREPRAAAPPLPFHDGNLPTRPRERRRVDRATAMEPDEPTLHAKRAILRWVQSTTDAPDAPGVLDESDRWWEPLNPRNTYQQR
ncbi:hypothetical protein DHEL01_v208781 [Diaporthe helianthi]|uniref:Uncharacterized protein n=1 Tax=Diaporthe helianthi TaxID=158607 RepID=A0A2P5HRE2_DIAHE|nr:hypothetical protein DHEL01_v208781 [Diaporthe helianthi]